ncbi:hypothetical protein GQR58_015149 [Nymphon striatum]|nr:hypothetical protein GQR58_015149 [Nymphon striatum]
MKYWIDYGTEWGENCIMNGLTSRKTTYLIYLKPIPEPATCRLLLTTRRVYGSERAEVKHTVNQSSSVTMSDTMCGENCSGGIKSAKLAPGVTHVEVFEDKCSLYLLLTSPRDLLKVVPLSIGASNGWDKEVEMLSIKCMRSMWFSRIRAIIWGSTGTGIKILRAYLNNPSNFVNGVFSMSKSFEFCDECDENMLENQNILFLTLKKRVGTITKNGRIILEVCRYILEEFEECQKQEHLTTSTHFNSKKKKKKTLKSTTRNFSEEEAEVYSTEWQW